MLNKKYGKIIATALMVTSLSTGLALSSVGNGISGDSIKIAYAADSTGIQTPTGVISGKIKYSNKIPENPILEQLKAGSISVNPTNNPEFFEPHMTTGTMLLSAGKMYISNNIYHYGYYYKDLGIQVDDFYHVYSMRLGSEGKVIKDYSVATYTDGQLVVKENYSIEYSDSKAYNYILNEGKVTPPVEPTEPTTPTNPDTKSYTSTRLGGKDRYTTALSIANKFSSGNKVNSVVLASGMNFPDALAGSVLAGKKDAPILLVGSTAQNSSTMTYIKNNLNSNGTVYILGGKGVISDSVINQIKSIGFKNIKRLGGKDRYDTNLSIVNETNVPKGTNIVVANSMSFADSLSISGIAGAKDMPIFLVNGSFDTDILAKIKNISPKQIYIVGGTGVVSSSIEKQLKSIGSVKRLGGSDRYATSLAIAKHFSTGATNAMVAYGLNFPDALAGSALASKCNAPILLVNNSNAKAQKTFLDSTKIKDLYILGDKGVVSDTIVNQLKK
ncbi:cell wall-binding repeat-containing protein [Clostridium sulfidigenes]|uniref:cell wall-binding repeat-containing protein n=1 Tax=Clostridium sulfidigenes TaxID=318464 RepID=UPI003F8AA085